MIRGTTPTLTFNISFDTANITDLNICFAQWGKVVLEKDLRHCELNGKSIVLPLTETDTLALNSSSLAHIQIRAACGEARLASNILSVPVGKILNDGVLR